jgi:methoxymalonate biosynthesis acyl carrier protein
MPTENTQSNRQVIRNYLLENINIPDLKDGYDIFDAGIVNSLFAIQLMTFLEKAFKIKVKMDDLDMNNFKSVDAVSAFVESKQGES